MYQSGTWLLSILWTVLCPQDFLATGWLSLTISRLFTGYQQAIAPNQYTSKHSHALLCTKVWHGCKSILWNGECSQDFLLLVGYRLAIDWLCPKINTCQDIAIFYYIPKWHMAAIYTLDCCVFTFVGYQLAIGWLFPKVNTLQDIFIHYVPKLHMAAINTLNCNSFTRFLDKLRQTHWLTDITTP